MGIQRSTFDLEQYWIFTGMGEDKQRTQGWCGRSVTCRQAQPPNALHSRVIARLAQAWFERERIRRYRDLYQEPNWWKERVAIGNVYG